tara:strand:- start:2697 stop:3668 length:972 start_codon:yes stop_codon:yes gene_type:complete
MALWNPSVYGNDLQGWYQPQPGSNSGFRSDDVGSGATPLTSANAGADIDDWIDSSGKGRNLVNDGDNEPTVVTNASLANSLACNFTVISSQDSHMSTSTSFDTDGQDYLMAAVIDDEQNLTAGETVVDIGSSSQNGMAIHYSNIPAFSFQAIGARIAGGLAASNNGLAGGTSTQLSNWTAKKALINDPGSSVVITRQGLSASNVSLLWCGLDVFTATHTQDTTSAVSLQIGRGGSGLQQSNGKISEVIVAYFPSGTLKDIEAQKVTGYLHHKFGIESQLVSTHPYKSVPPLHGVHGVHGTLVESPLTGDLNGFIETGDLSGSL